MIAPLAKFIDWSALQMAYVVAPLRHAPRPKWKLEEALEFLNGPDFIPAASDPAQIECDGPRHFKFPTPRPCEVQHRVWPALPLRGTLAGATGDHSIGWLSSRRLSFRVSIACPSGQSSRIQCGHFGRSLRASAPSAPTH